MALIQKVPDQIGGPSGAGEQEQMAIVDGGRHWFRVSPAQYRHQLLHGAAVTS
jgi:hypothetical protein